MAVRELGRPQGNPLALKARCEPVADGNLSEYRAGIYLTDYNYYTISTMSGTEYPVSLMCFNKNELFTIAFSVSTGARSAFKMTLNDGLTTRLSDSVVAIQNFPTRPWTVNSYDYFNVHHSENVRISQGGLVVTYSGGSISVSLPVPGTGTLTVGSEAYSNLLITQVLKLSNGGYVFSGRANVSSAYVSVIFVLDELLSVTLSKKLTTTPTREKTSIFEADFGYVAFAESNTSTIEIVTLDKQFSQIGNLSSGTSYSNLFTYYDRSSSIAVTTGFSSSTIKLAQWTVQINSDGTIGYARNVQNIAVPYGMNTFQGVVEAVGFPYISSSPLVVRTPDGLGVDSVKPLPSRFNVSGEGLHQCIYGSCKKLGFYGAFGGTSLAVGLPEFKDVSLIGSSQDLGYQDQYIRHMVEIDGDRAAHTYVRSDYVGFGIAKRTI